MWLKMITNTSLFHTNYDKTKNIYKKTINQFCCIFIASKSLSKFKWNKTWQSNYLSQDLFV